MTTKDKKTNEKRLCRDCGAKIKPSRTKKGKHKGSIYYRKLCPECYLKMRRSLAEKNRTPEMYDSFRKHFTKTCAYCGDEFSVKGLRNAGKIKCCSKECSNKYKSKISKDLKKGEKLQTESVFDARSKSQAGRPKTHKKLRADENNINGKEFHFISPDGVDYKGRNISHFVRTHPHLFSSEDLREKVQKHGRRGVSKRCNASYGLSRILNGYNCSWKGWTVATPYYEDKRR